MKKKEPSAYDLAKAVFLRGEFVVADSPFGRAMVRGMSKRQGFNSIQTLGGWQIAADSKLTTFKTANEALRYLNEKTEK